ncbi:MAG: MBL fold metallo-hydrolase [Chloroflexi bacterium]|nr:MBL fold metallo-hydrolase [Chloroflexota bacterium]
MIELIFLGTSASAPSIERGLSATMLLHRDQRFLIDCGEGTQRQLLLSGLGFKKLDKVLLTHGHLDHILGLGGLVSTFARWEALPTLTIYGGPWALDRVGDLLGRVVFRGDEPEMHVTYQPVEPGPIWTSEHLTVSAFPVSHRGRGCYGYCFQEETKRPFLVEEAERLGVPAGPERRRLVAGEPITLADGRVIAPEMVLGPQVPGPKLVYVGDAGRTDDLLEVARGADALVIEATYVDSEAEMAARFGHLTARQAAELARDAGVGELYLSHVSRRYPGKVVQAEARQVFPGAVVVQDFDHVRVLGAEKAEEQS